MTTPIMKRAIPSNEEIAKELAEMANDIGCLCGIPGCKGHPDLGGFIEVSRSELHLLSGDDEA